MWDKLRWALAAWRIYDAAEAAARKEAPMKSIFASKTFWFNVIAGVIGVCQAQGLFTAIPAPYGPAVVALVNLALRYVTVEPVTLPRPS